MALCVCVSQIFIPCRAREHNSKGNLKGAKDKGGKEQTSDKEKEKPTKADTAVSRTSMKNHHF